MEFHFELSNADTGEEYGDGNMMVLRGTRLVVKRAQAPKGKGILRRLEQNEYSSGNTEESHESLNNFYTIDSTKKNDDELLVTEISTSTAHTIDLCEEDDLQALQAVTDEFVARTANDTSMRYSIAEITYQRGQNNRKTRTMHPKFSVDRCFANKKRNYSQPNVSLAPLSGFAMTWI